MILRNICIILIFFKQLFYLFMSYFSLGNIFVPNQWIIKHKILVKSQDARFQLFLPSHSISARRLSNASFIS